MFSLHLFLPFFCGAVLSLLIGCATSEQRTEANMLPTANEEPVGDLAAWAAALQAQPGMKGASMGLYVIELETGSEVAAYEADRGLATASTMKAVTTAAALAILGPDYRFETVLEYDGAMNGGTVSGNLYLRGGGDPTLGSDNAESLMLFFANRLKENGVKRIEGHVVGDASLFGSAMAPRSWSWDDMGNYYGAGPSGLNIGENAYRIFFKTGARVGDATQLLRTDPVIEGLSFENEVKTAGAQSGDNAYIYGTEYGYDRVVRGTLPANQSAFIIKGSVPDPPLLAAQMLTAALKKVGIEVAKPATTNRLSKPTLLKRTQLYQHFSVPLRDIVATTNQKSNNLYAECLLRMVGVRQKGEGSNEAGAEAIQDFWAKKGVDMSGAFIEDGSGLSRFNALSARQMAQIVRLAIREDISGAYLASLPVAGETGTLKSLAKGTAAQGRVRAKSGSINRVRAYSGLAETKGGKKLVFSVMINNYDRENLGTDFSDLFVRMVNE